MIAVTAPGHPVKAGAGYDCCCGECLARRALLLAALEDAAGYRDVRADLAHCESCASADGPGLCPDHERDLELAAAYRALAAELGEAR